MLHVRPRSGRRAGVFLLGVILLIGAGTSAPARAQEAETSQMPERPDADPADVASVEAIVEAVYESISGTAEEPRDWDRFRSLFVPKARLIPTARDTSGAVHYTHTIESYIDLVRPIFAKEPFFEREIHAQVERFGDIAHVFSTYESRRSPDDAEPFQRGINSIQLWHDGDRWWIVTIFWHAEGEGRSIPERYGG